MTDREQHIHSARVYLAEARRIRPQLQRLNVAAEKAGFHRTESITS